MQLRELLEEKKDFTEVEQRIADYFLLAQEALKHQSAREIAKRIYVSASALSRLAQKLGFDGFLSFKEAYLKELAYYKTHFLEIDANYPFAPQDKNTVIASKIGSLYHEMIDDVLALISHDTLQAAMRMLQKADCIYIFSAGVQSETAAGFKDKMLRIGRRVVISSRADEAFYLAASCRKNDVFLIISYSGNTEMTLRVARKVKEQHLAMIALTSYSENALSKLADVCLHVSTREKLRSNLGDFGMNLSVLLLLDILYAGVFNDDYYQNRTFRIQTAEEFEILRNSKHPLLKESSNTVSKKEK